VQASSGLRLERHQPIEEKVAANLLRGHDPAFAQRRLITNLARWVRHSAPGKIQGPPSTCLPPAGVARRAIAAASSFSKRVSADIQAPTFLCRDCMA